MGARNPAFDVRLPTSQTGYVLDLGGVFVRDFHTGERRYGTIKDVGDAFWKN
ncbi:MAG: hypothetical protein K9L30_00925 [Desulfobacterales bacterium]|nr:hypothetical protein [Desulfobacterales bacterium]